MRSTGRFFSGAIRVSSPAMLGLAMLTLALEPMVDGRPGALAVTVVPTDFVVEDVIPPGVISNVCGFAFLPDGRAVFVQMLSGQVRLAAGGVASTPIATVSEVATSGGRGLMGVAVDPRWPTPAYMYFMFNHTSGNVYVRRYTATGDLTNPSSLVMSLGDPYNIITDIRDLYAQHSGGTVRFGLDSTLFISSGDDDVGGPCFPQDVTSLLGKILRIDVRGLPAGPGGPPAKSLITPAGNPFPGPNENERLVWALGLRNPFRFNIDRLTGKLYMGDVGEQAWEELDECSGGENFGWPLREGAHDRATTCSGSTGIDPIYEYPNQPGQSSIIPAGFYRPGTNPGGGAYRFPIEYYGDMLIHEHYAGWIRRLTKDSLTGTWDIAPAVDGQPTSTEWATGIVKGSDFQIGPDGALYYVQGIFDTAPNQAFRRIKYVGPATGVPASQAAAAVRPNPFRPEDGTQFHFSLPARQKVSLTIFDVNGTEIRQIVDGVLAGGEHTVHWDGRDMTGHEVVPGIYFRVLETSGERETQKFTVLR